MLGLDAATTAAADQREARRPASRTSSSPAASSASWPTAIRAAATPRRIEAVTLESGAGAGLSAGRRRTRIHARGPAARASSTARARASTASSSTTRTGWPAAADRQGPARRRPAGPIPETGGRRGPGTPGEDIRLTIDAGLQLAVEQEVLAAWIADNAKSVVRGRDGPLHRRDLRRGDATRRTTPTTTRDRERRPDAASSTRSCRTSTSRARCSRC